MGIIEMIYDKNQSIRVVSTPDSLIFFSSAELGVCFGFVA